MTARGIAFAMGAVTAGLVGRLLGLRELYVVAATAGALVLICLLAVRLLTARVAARRDIPTMQLLSGARAEVSLELRNDSRVPALALLVEETVHPSLSDTRRFVVAGLRPGGTTRLSYTVRGTVRGRHPVGPVAVRVRDPFGLAERVRRFRAISEVLVYPPIERLGSGPARGHAHGSGTSDIRRLYARGEEFHSMREYVQGDDLRQVHWPSTARRQQLMVRQLELPERASATVLLDTRAGAHIGTGPASTLEKAVSIAASIVWHLADEGYALRLATVDTHRPPPQQGWDTLLDQLATVTTSRRGSLPTALQAIRGTGAEGVFVAVLAPPVSDDVADSPDVRALLQAGRPYATRIALVVHDRARRVTSERALVLARLLGARGWRTTDVAVDEPLAERWQGLARRPVTAGS